MQHVYTSVYTSVYKPGKGSAQPGGAAAPSSPQQLLKGNGQRGSEALWDQGSVKLEILGCRYTRICFMLWRNPGP